MSKNINDNILNFLFDDDADLFPDDGECWGSQATEENDTHCSNSTSGGSDNYTGESEDNLNDSECPSSENLTDSLGKLFALAIGAGFAARSVRKQQEREEEAQQEAEWRKEQLKREKARKEKNKLRQKRVVAFFFKRKKIAIPCDYEKLIRKSANYVAKVFYDAAFSDIKTVPIKDIHDHSTHKIGKVEQIIIGSSSYFRKGDLIPYDTKIVITYHEKMEITVPSSGRSLRKLNYTNVRERLQELGFSKIYEMPLCDLVTGWIKKDGAVEKVIIGEHTSFKKNCIFPYDAKVTIKYHTFKRKEIYRNS
jgi:hypothetical protein